LFVGYRDSTLDADAFLQLEVKRYLGWPGHGWRSLVDRAGEEHFALLRYNKGPADYWPGDWSRVAPHELPGPRAPA
jgi:hypothetical protein